MGETPWRFESSHPHQNRLTETKTLIGPARILREPKLRPTVADAADDDIDEIIAPKVRGDYLELSMVHWLNDTRVWAFHSSTLAWTSRWRPRARHLI